MIDRMAKKKKKGFNMRSNTTDNHNEEYTPVDFAKIKVGAKVLDDAVLTLGNFHRLNPRLGKKENVIIDIKYEKEGCNT